MTDRQRERPRHDPDRMNGLHEANRKLQQAAKDPNGQTRFREACEEMQRVVRGER